MKLYRKKNTQPMRPHVPGEDMTGISVSPDDIDRGYLDRPGGMVAHAPSNPDDRWYINPDFFAENYEEVSDD